MDMDVLRKPITLDLTLDALRMIIGCFKAVAYQEELDDEAYLDPDAEALMESLERRYEATLEGAARTVR
jgi:hypothetical protein